PEPTGRYLPTPPSKLSSTPLRESCAESTRSPITPWPSPPLLAPGSSNPTTSSRPPRSYADERTRKHPRLPQRTDPRLPLRPPARRRVCRRAHRRLQRHRHSRGSQDLPLVLPEPTGRAHEEPPCRSQAMDRQCQGEEEGRVKPRTGSAPSQSVPDSTATGRIRD